MFKLADEICEEVKKEIKDDIKQAIEKAASKFVELIKKHEIPIMVPDEEIPNAKRFNRDYFVLRSLVEHTLQQDFLIEFIWQIHMDIIERMKDED